MANEGFKRKLTAILIADVEDYSRLKVWVLLERDTSALRKAGLPEHPPLKAVDSNVRCLMGPLKLPLKALTAAFRPVRASYFSSRSTMFIPFLFVPSHRRLTENFF